MEIGAEPILGVRLVFPKKCGSTPIYDLTDVTDADLAATDYTYDALNRLERIQDALNGLTDFTYDVHDNLTSVSAPNRAVTDYTYDNLDNLTEEDSPDRGVITYTHDAAGNVATMTDARNKVTTYTYDDLNRLTEIELDNTDTITFQYDTGTYAKGRLNKITDPSGETTWTFNQFGDITGKTQKIGTISLTASYAYDTAGRLSTMTLPSGKVVTYGYDDHLTTSVTVGSTTILSAATYEPFGPVNGWTWGNTTSHSRGFSTRGLMTSHSMVTDTRTLTYDNVGRPATLDDLRHDLDFDYNVLGQITDFNAAGSAPLTSQDYTYDENGNRQTLVQNSTTYNYTITNNTNRLASTTGPTAKTNTFDAAGNITDDGTYDFAYDDRGRLVDVDAGSVTYEHNGQGQRVKKNDGTNVTLYVYDEAGQLIGEYDGSGNLVQEHVWFNGMPVAVLTSSDEYYVHVDHLGTPRIVSDGNTVIWRWESGPFGEEVAQEDPDGDSTDFTYNLRFPGQYYDVETGLHYNYYRTLDPATGRYLESDPIGLIGGTNTYGYALGNPINLYDPYGLWVPQAIAGVLGGASAGIAAALSGADLGTILTNTAIGATAGVMTTLPGLNAYGAATLSGLIGAGASAATQAFEKGVKCISGREVAVAAVAGVIGGGIGNRFASRLVPNRNLPANPREYVRPGQAPRQLANPSSESIAGPIRARAEALAAGTIGGAANLIGNELTDSNSSCECSQ